MSAGHEPEKIRNELKDYFDNQPILKDTDERHRRVRDTDLEKHILEWISSVVHVKPDQKFENFLQDGSVLSLLMTNIVFNSVPQEDIERDWGADAARDRVNAVVREIERYGVKDVFHPDDLLHRRNLGRVAKCLVELAQMTYKDDGSLLAAKK